MVVCLSTPHVYLEMQNADHKLLNVPVYCTREAREKTKAIVSIWPDGDAVPGFWADLAKGITRDDAILPTRS